MQEANKKVIELHDDVSSEAIMIMLGHLYGADYGPTEGMNLDSYESEYFTPKFHLSVFMLGDKYDISSLRDAAATAFDRYLSDEIKEDGFCDESIYLIQSLLGPNALQLADGSLTLVAREIVLEHVPALIFNELARSFLAEGTMLNKDLAMTMLQELAEYLEGMT